MGLRMDLLDLAIIYLACGAPFAVQYSFRSKDHGRAEKAARCVLAGLAWPILTFLYVRDAVQRLGHRTPVQCETKHLIDDIRQGLENSVDLSGRPDAAFEFRRTVLRWAELAVAVRQPTASPAAEGVWEISGHTRPDIASNAYIHREKRLLDAHFEAARKDMLGLAGSLRSNAEFRMRALEAARSLDDEVSVQALTEIENIGSSLAAAAQH